LYYNGIKKPAFYGIMILFYYKFLIDIGGLPNEKEILEKLVLGYWVFYSCLFLEWLIDCHFIAYFLTKRRTFT